MSDEKTWAAVDAFAASHMQFSDPVLAEVLRNARAKGLPAIDVSEAQGRLLALLVAFGGARRILEIGTLGGYSAICMARALPEGGKLISLEFSPLHAEVARQNIASAGLADRIEVRVGPAVETLAGMEEEGLPPFDMAFVDADKANNATYIAYCLKLCRSGAVIICDNVVRDGAVVDPALNDAGVTGAREAIAEMGRLAPAAATIVQTVGTKGYDGFAIMLAP